MSSDNMDEPQEDVTLQFDSSNTPTPETIGDWRVWSEGQIEDFWQLWYNKLLNPTFTQTRNTLWRMGLEHESDARPVGFCCLGLGCNVLHELKVGRWVTGLPDATLGVFDFGIEAEDVESFEDAEWPYAFCEKIKMSAEFGALLIRFNDTYKLTFSQIAREIRLYTSFRGIHIIQSRAEDV
jgi:hypothetical protein